MNEANWIRRNGYLSGLGKTQEANIILKSSWIRASQSMLTSWVAMLNFSCLLKSMILTDFSELQGPLLVSKRWNTIIWHKCVYVRRRLKGNRNYPSWYRPWLPIYTSCPTGLWQQWAAVYLKVQKRTHIYPKQVESFYIVKWWKEEGSSFSREKQVTKG